MNADELVREYILRKYQEDYDPHCAEVRVAECDSYDSTYGCETGCEYARFEAVITCPHQEPFAYEYGEFGDLSFILDDIERGLL